MFKLDDPSHVVWKRPLFLQERRVREEDYGLAVRELRFYQCDCLVRSPHQVRHLVCFFVPSLLDWRSDLRWLVFSIRVVTLLFLLHNCAILRVNDVLLDFLFLQLLIQLCIGRVLRTHIRTAIALDDM